MATVPNQNQKTQPTVKPTPVVISSRPARVVKKDEPRGNQTFLFGKENYTWMIGGVVLILIGFALMSGGKSPDPHQFNYDEIYSFRRITLAPIVILAGFVVEVFAIMKKPKETIG
ncbi:MAG: DUF3098 domain-containing protein [Flavipsychrobacter sp.]|nr:DUF3098 domain-containing protein [Flavipsychrobacter sp.]